MHISYAHAARGLFPDDLGAEYLPNVFRLQQAMNADDEYATSMLAIVELLKYGTTTFIDPGTTTHLEHCMTVYDQAGCRIVIGRQRAGPPQPAETCRSTGPTKRYERRKMSLLWRRAEEVN